MWLPECIGIPFVDEDLTSARLSGLAAQGRRQKRPDGGEQIDWLDERSGAALFFNLDGAGKIVCVRPAFQSAADFRGVLEFFGTDADGCRFCDPLVASRVVNDEGTKLFSAFHIANLGVVRQGMRTGDSVDLIVSGFAEGIRAWRSAEEYLVDLQEDTNLSNYCGYVYNPKAPSPHEYLASGEVLQAELRTNAVTNVAFWALWIAAPFGDSAGFSILAREEDLPFGVEPGHYVEANVWACGVAMIEAPRKKGLIQRLFH
jgi:hypothetical protein